MLLAPHLTPPPPPPAPPPPLPPLSFQAAGEDFERRLEEEAVYRGAAERQLAWAVEDKQAEQAHMSLLLQQQELLLQQQEQRLAQIQVQATDFDCELREEYEGAIQALSSQCRQYEVGGGAVQALSAQCRQYEGGGRGGTGTQCAVHAVRGGGRGGTGTQCAVQAVRGGGGAVQALSAQCRLYEVRTGSVWCSYQQPAPHSLPFPCPSLPASPLTSPPTHNQDVVDLLLAQLSDAQQQLLEQVHELDTREPDLHVEQQQVHPPAPAGAVAVPGAAEAAAAAGAEEQRLWQELQLLLRELTERRAQGTAGNGPAGSGSGSATTTAPASAPDYASALLGSPGCSSRGAGRCSLLSCAVSQLRVLRDEHRRMTRVLRKLGREGGPMQQLEAARQENTALLVKYTAVQVRGRKGGGGGGGQENKALLVKCMVVLVKGTAGELAGEGGGVGA